MDTLGLSADVSRETIELLNALESLVVKWNPTINLISKATVGELWTRHILDSAQIAELGHSGDHWVDIGSGGGFPGLVVAIFAAQYHPQRHTVMIESDMRKATFLRTCIRELSLKADVKSQRIEAVTPQNADVLSARALADLPLLLEHASRHLKPDGTALFMKGATWEKEVETAQDSWSFSYIAHKSKTNASAAILEVKGIERV